MLPEVSLQDLKQEGDMYNQTRAKLEQNLASPDKAKREKAMSLLCLWLTSQKDVKEEELTKIWKGLFYCLWHAEKAVAQADLVERIARVMENLDDEISLQFLKVFLTTLRNEWGGIDKNNLGKFHLLLGQYVSQMFALLKKSEWDSEIVRNFMAALVERAFLVQDEIDANDVNVYIAGVYFHELRQYLPIPADVFKMLLEPFWVSLVKGCDERVAEEISKKVFLVLFDDGTRLLTSAQGMQEGDKEEKPCFADVALELSFYIRTKSSALLSTSQSNSGQLRLIEEKFSSLERMLAQSHIGISTNGDNEIVINDQIETQRNADGVNSLAERTDILQSSISPVEFPAMRTFGRRSKRNQKLLFSPQTVGDVYMKATVVKSGISLEDMPAQTRREDESVELGSKGGMAGECTSLGKSQVNMAVPEHSLQIGDIIDVDGSPPNQDTLISDEADNSNMLSANDDGITMEDPVISNLAKRFESITDQPPCCEVGVSPKATTPLAPSPINTGGRKRKSWKSSPLNTLDTESPTSAKENNVVPLDPFQEDDITSIDNLSAKKAKKVHFSLQHNIVWKPSTPLPPHDVRVPPAATPRGSALKKGVPPGPIVDSSDVPSVSPKKKKSGPRKAPSAHYRSPKSLKNSAKVTKPTKKGRLSPR